MDDSQTETVTVKSLVDEHNEKVRKRYRKRRIAILSLLTILGLAIALPMASYTAHWFGSEAIAQETAPANPRANYWRAVKEGVSGYSSIGGPESGVLVQAAGSDWQQKRGGFITQKLPWLIVAVAVLLFLFHIMGGKAKLDRPRSGRMIKRWSWFDRLVHWVTAISFVALAVTGLSMLIGKAILIPLLGKAGFASWAQVCIQMHNVVGPIFAVGIVLMIVMWIWYNFPSRVDFAWLMSAGGMFNKDSHPSAGRLNAGEKLWFWLLATGGVVVCLTGIVMVLPLYGIAVPSWAEALPLVSGSRGEMQQANLLHAILGIIWIAVALGHIYIGTAGTEGAFEGMATGYVSEEWAIQHHDLWAQKMIDQGKVVERSLEAARLDHPARST